MVSNLEEGLVTTCLILTLLVNKMFCFLQLHFFLSGLIFAVFPG